jgi:hypothetical protein
LAAASAAPERERQVVAWQELEKQAPTLLEPTLQAMK